MLNFTLNPFLVMAIAACVPTLLGFIWYHPKVFGKAWLQAAGLDEQKAKEGFNMPLVFGLSLLLSFVLAFSLAPMVIHQFGFMSMMADAEGQKMLADQSTEYYRHAYWLFNTCKDNFHTFRHGALHGAILGMLTVLPIIATNGMFERKGFKYIAINSGYWLICLSIMGAIVCHFMPHTGIFQVPGF